MGGDSLGAKTSSPHPTANSGLQFSHSALHHFSILAFKSFVFRRERGHSNFRYKNI
jgi:hypothetical protein